jgi:hypothetical protein
MAPVSGVGWRYECEERVEREFFIDSLMARIHLVIAIIRWTGLGPWEFEFPFPGSLASTFLGGVDLVLHLLRRFGVANLLALLLALRHIAPFDQRLLRVTV